MVAAARQNVEATGQAVAEAAKTDAEATGRAIAAAAQEDAETTGSTVAAAAREDAAATGQLVASAARTNAESTGLAVAAAARDDADSTGQALASAAQDDPQATGQAVASAAAADSEATGGALASSAKTNAAATGAAVGVSAKANAAATTDAMAAGPAKDPQALQDLGAVIPVEPWTPEDEPEEGPDPSGEGHWNEVGSPAPISAIFARFKAGIPAAKVNVEDVDLSLLPKALPQGRILATDGLLRLSAEEFNDTDVLTAHTTMFVTKSWISSNQIHEWSIQFSRFDEEQEAWRPSTANRVGEDAERVFFSVGIPGFSIWAITGSVDVPEVQFLVDDLEITPAEVQEGETVTVQVKVTNLTEESGEYNAILFVNDQVKRSARLPLGASESKNVAFEVAPNIAGEYGVRVDRLLGSFTVVPVLITPTVVPPTPVPPTVVPPTVTPPPPPTPIAAVPRERGPGFPIGIILGVLTAIAVAVAGIAYYLRGRELPPVPPSPPAEEGSPAEGEEPPAAEAEEPPAAEGEEPAAAEAEEPPAAEAEEPTAAEAEGPPAAEAEEPPGEAEEAAEEPTAEVEEPPAEAAPPEEELPQGGAGEGEEGTRGQG